jgi:hypothetical protein
VNLKVAGFTLDNNIILHCFTSLKFITLFCSERQIKTKMNYKYLSVINLSSHLNSSLKDFTLGQPFTGITDKLMFYKTNLLKEVAAY